MLHRRLVLLLFKIITKSKNLFMSENFKMLKLVLCLTQIKFVLLPKLLKYFNTQPVKEFVSDL